MSIHRPIPATDMPILTIARWSIYELPDRSRHIVGVALGEGRVSSAVISFNKETKTITTRTGRQYILVGESAPNISAAYVWETWCSIYKITSWVDVSEEYE